MPEQARRSQLNGPGAAGGPASAGTATATDELRTAAANISTAEYVLMCASPEFREVTSKYRRDHGWFKIRFAPNANDINWILSDEVCVADFMMLLRCAFRYRGLLLTSSQAKAFVPYYKHRQLTRIKLCKHRLDDTFNRIVSWARFNPSQMIDPSGQGGGGGPAQCQHLRNQHQRRRRRRRRRRCSDPPALVLTPFLKKNSERKGSSKQKRESWQRPRDAHWPHVPSNEYRNEYRPCPHKTVHTSMFCLLGFEIRPRSQYILACRTSRTRGHR